MIRYNLMNAVDVPLRAEAVFARERVVGSKPMMQYVIRFLLGGVVVSLFAMIGDVLRPKSFAGLFGAAPSVALATIGLTVHSDGGMYAAMEARSMMLGAVGFMLYAALVCRVLMRTRASSLVTTVALLPVWFGTSFLLWFVMTRWG